MTLGDILDGYGFRRTRAREKILKVLVASRRPLSQEEIGRRMGNEAPDRVTIYRTLEAFRRAGLVHRAYTRRRRWVYETAERCTPRQCHPHFTCHGCGQTTCMADVVVPLARGLPEGFVADRQRVHLEGWCPDCSAKARR